MPRKTIGEISFAKVYPMYVQKVERKGRTRAELDEVIRWLTGYDQPAIERYAGSPADFAEFFASAPAIHPNADRITGKICGIRVEEIADPVEKRVRQLDKVVDELAQGKSMEKILR